MIRFSLPGTDLSVTRLGLGTVELGMPYGIGSPAPPADGDCVYLLHWALDQGIAYFDTAAGYGRSEELLGRAFSGRADRPVVATKVAITDPETGALRCGQALAAHLGNSLLRSCLGLGVDTLDLVQIHAPATGLFLNPDLLEIMDRTKASGQVRHWGVSTYGLEQPADALRYPLTVRTIQLAFNLLDRAPLGEIFPACSRSGVGLILRSVFLKGALSDRLDTLPESLAPLKRAGAAARRIAEGMGISLPALALRYCASQPLAQVVLVGTASQTELARNLEAFADGPLPEQVLMRIGAIAMDDQELLNPGNWGIA